MIPKMGGWGITCALVWRQLGLQILVAMKTETLPKLIIGKTFHHERNYNTLPKLIMGRAFHHERNHNSYLET